MTGDGRPEIIGHVYSGIEVAGLGVLKHIEGDWYKAEGELWVHFMEVDGHRYIDCMAVNKKSWLRRLLDIFG